MSEISNEQLSPQIPRQISVFAGPAIRCPDLLRCPPPLRQVHIRVPIKPYGRSSTPRERSGAHATYRIPFDPAAYDEFVLPALPALNNLDTYGGLTYNDFDVNQIGVNGEAQLTGIKPHTKPNNIVSGIQALSTTGWNPGFSTDGTDTKYFDLKSFYFGCAVNTIAGAEGVAQQCTIKVRGYGKLEDANPVASKQFSFNPNILDLLIDPKLATFDGKFSAIQRVEIVQIEATTGEALNVIVLDDVAYNLYK